MLSQIKQWLRNGPITKNGVLPVTTLFFWKYCLSLRTSYTELICCTNNPNAHICTFCKRWNFIWRGFFPVSILKKRLQHRCFPVNIAKFFRTLNLKKDCARLFLYFLLFCSILQQMLQEIGKHSNKGVNFKQTVQIQQMKQQKRCKICSRLRIKTTERRLLLTFYFTLILSVSDLDLEQVHVF